MQDQLDRMPDAMGVRRQTVEHPFGTLKAAGRVDHRHRYRIEVREGGLQTLRWREVDSNSQFRAEMGFGLRLPNGSQCDSASCPG